jgi:hypothetical protein
VLTSKAKAIESLTTLRRKWRNGMYGDLSVLTFTYCHKPSRGDRVTVPLALRVPSSLQAWDDGTAQGDSGKSALLPGDLRPIHETQHVPKFCIVVVIVEELFKDVHGAVKARRRGPSPVLLSIRGVNALNGSPIETHPRTATF